MVHELRVAVSCIADDDQGRAFKMLARVEEALLVVYGDPWHDGELNQLMGATVLTAWEVGTPPPRQGRDTLRVHEPRCSH